MIVTVALAKKKEELIICLFLNIQYSVDIDVGVEDRSSITTSNVATKQLSHSQKKKKRRRKNKTTTTTKTKMKTRKIEEKLEKHVFKKKQQMGEVAVAAAVVAMMMPEEEQQHRHCVCVCVYLDFLNLLADHDRIVLSDLILAEFLVVKAATVLVGVAMLPAVKSATSAVETYIATRKKNT